MSNFKKILNLFVTKKKTMFTYIITIIAAGSNTFKRDVWDQLLFTKIITIIVITDL